MAIARSRRDRGIDYWPGFVDALSTLLLGIIFLLSVFVLVQFFLSQEVTGKDTALSRLNAQIAQLTDLLSLEKTGKLSLEEQLAQLRAGLSSAEGERDRFRGLYEGLGSGAASAQGKVNELNTALDSEKRITARALAQVEVLNQQISALRRQLAALEEAVEASEKRDKESQGRIADLGQRLNIALAQRVQAILKPEGRAELDKLAAALSDLDRQIPAEIAWVLRVDGHTDVRPIATPQFPSNWELSSARAIAVVQYLISKGISAQRLVAAGFGEFQPLDAERSEDAFRRNRRIELKLTER